MHPCPSCNRHLRSADATCPFCGTTRALPFGRAFHAVGGAVTAMVLAACYGSPYTPGKLDSADTGLVDMDEDGALSDVDCDDANADVNPSAEEACNDMVDNDCDGKVDADDETCMTGR